ncbi:hypothetical protein LCGC14_1948610 [marine sediment metagenome]|uniref:Uncharacterized protein n=1 Tax=marine sediment metagenome TaxID=412755 RepID=A0A0F9FI15_9ZZZZ
MKKFSKAKRNYKKSERKTMNRADRRTNKISCSYCEYRILKLREEYPNCGLK